MSLLKDINIKAFSDLKEAYYFNGQKIKKKLSEIDDYNAYIGLFKCHNRKHNDYYAYIWDRFESEESDNGCPYCFYEKKGDILFKCILNNAWGSSKISYIYYCNKCKRIQFYDNKDERITSHICTCKHIPDAFEFYNKIQLLNQSEVEISKELDSANNILKSNQIRDYNLDKIPETSSFYGLSERDNENLLFEFKCSKCNEIYKTTLNYRKNRKNSCPYCNDTFAHEKDSIKIVYPNIAKQYYRLNRIPVEKASARKLEQQSYYKCSKCGIIQLKSLNEAISNKCIICENGFNKIDIKRIFQEIMTPDHLNTISEIIYYKRKVPFIARCSTCSQTSYINLYDYFFVDRNYCMFCKGFDAIPGKTSLKALFPELIEKYWDYLDNLVDPDRITDKTTIRIYYRCPDCNYVSKINVDQLVRFYKRNIQICTFCKGLRNNKIHYF